MSVIVRTLLICLMALAFPVQGMATFTSACAAVMTHQADPQVQQAQEHAHHHASGHDDAQTQVQAQHAQHEPASDEHAPAHKCSTGGGAHCTICAALPTHTFSLTLVSAPAPLMASAEIAESTFSPEGLERPPRHILR